MAFDYGSIDLGLRNPFKIEGTVVAAKGAVQGIIGLYLLIQAAASVKNDTVVGWILVFFGILLLAGGLKALASGIYATLRYFVGRNHPTSLSLNRSQSESSTAQEESSYIAYSEKELEEMLLGRKNTTFVEPKGFLARVLLSLFPKLLFMPYLIRNMAQRVFSAWVKTLIAVIAYVFVAFVLLAGFAGDSGPLTFPVYSALLVIYLLLVWRTAGLGVSRAAELSVDTLGSRDLVRVIAAAIILPVVIALGFSYQLRQGSITVVEMEELFTTLPDFHQNIYLFGIIAMAALASALVISLLRFRLDKANPVVEVSELRENWQESVHPNEIFINLDNLVMANRRYKEVPNRVYREFDPHLEEQVEGKGSFRGEMIQEVQPKVFPVEMGEAYKKNRLYTLIAGHLLALFSVVFTVLLAYAIIDTYRLSTAMNIDSVSEVFDVRNSSQLLDQMMTVFHFFLLAFFFRSLAKLLANTAHIFFAEIQFESLLVYFKCEGTFTESKISTGTGIHDSTRSENTLVRSSITPWVVVSKIISTTFAASGMRNLEHPRHILEMHKSDDELLTIRTDVMAFLKDRESIASITSERDLGNASQIHQLNQQTRAMPDYRQLQQDEEAGGYLSRESDLEKQENTERE